MENPFLIVDDERFEPIALRTRQRKNWAGARDRTIAFQNLTKEKFDQKHKPILYPEGTKVLRTNHDTREGLVAKFRPKWRGPYLVVEQLDNNVCKIMDIRKKPNLSRLKLVVSVRELKQYNDEIHSGDVSEDDSEEATDSDSETESESDFSIDFSKTYHSKRKFTNQPIFITPPSSNSSLGSPHPVESSSHAVSQPHSRQSVSSEADDDPVSITNSEKSQSRNSHSSQSFLSCQNAVSNSRSSQESPQSSQPSVRVVSVAQEPSLLNSDEAETLEETESRTLRRSVRTRYPTSRFSPSQYP